MKATELKKIREELGLTTSALAAATGVHVTTIRRYESGRRHITEEFAEKVKKLSEGSPINLEVKHVAEAQMTKVRTRYQNIYMDLSKVSGDLQYAEVAIKDLGIAECYELAGRVKRCESILKEVMHELAVLDGKALKNIEVV